jgi:hypothetical protein
METMNSRNKCMEHSMSQQQEQEQEQEEQEQGQGQGQEQEQERGLTWAEDSSVLRWAGLGVGDYEHL